MKLSSVCLVMLWWVSELLLIIVSMCMVIVLQLLGGGLRSESARMGDHLVLVLVHQL